MTALLMAPVILSLLLLAAHASRAGLPLPLAVGVLLLAGLLAVRRPWAALVLQGVLIVGAAEWIRTAIVLTSARQAAGMPSARLVIILTAVAALTLGSALVLRHPRLRRHFRGD